jgi:hypothetical protein
MTIEQREGVWLLVRSNVFAQARAGFLASLCTVLLAHALAKEGAVVIQTSIC